MEAKRLELKMQKWQPEMKNCDLMQKLLTQRRNSLLEEKKNIVIQQSNLAKADVEVAQKLETNNNAVTEQTASQANDYQLGLSCDELLHSLQQVRCLLQAEQSVLKEQQIDLAKAHREVTQNLEKINLAFTIVDHEKAKAVLKIKIACLKSRLTTMEDAVVVNDLEHQEKIGSSDSVKHLLDSLRSDARAAELSEGSHSKTDSDKKKRPRYPPTSHIKSCTCAGCINHPRTNKLMNQKLQPGPGSGGHKRTKN